MAEEVVGKEDPGRLVQEIKGLREEVAALKRANRELLIQVHTIQKSEQAHIARTKYRNKQSPTHSGPFHSPGEEEY